MKKSNEKMARNSGITLIALVITIIVLMILAGVVISSLTNDESVIGAAQNASEAYDEGATEEKGIIDKMLNKLANSMVAKDGSWNGTQKVNSPLLMEGMTPVYWSTDGGETASTTQEGAVAIYATIDDEGNPSSTGKVNSKFVWDNWYNYVAGDNSTDTKTSRWANAVTDDGSYWVWIPRFKYKLDYTGVGTTAGNTVAGKVDVIFVKTEECSGAEGYTTIREEYTVSGTTYEFITYDENGYILHPAFENGSTTSNKAETEGWTDDYQFNNGEWDAELPGFWVAKYEMSMEDGNGNAVSSATNWNVGLGPNVKMVSKPGVTSWRNIMIGNMFSNCLAYAPEQNSHMMKSSEWGAVAYLTHSQYGRNGNEININNSSGYITGSAGNSPTAGQNVGTTAYNTTTGMLASTTGNIYGVYDMSGGAWEYVAVWDKKANVTAVSTYGSVFASYNGLSTKYATGYTHGADTDYGTKVRNVNRVGDAAKEVYVSGDRGWFNDYSHLVETAYPFADRGGHYFDGAAAGVFFSHRASGESGVSGSFRAVLCGEAL